MALVIWFWATIIWNKLLSVLMAYGYYIHISPAAAVWVVRQHLGPAPCSCQQQRLLQGMFICGPVYQRNYGHCRGCCYPATMIDPLSGSTLACCSPPYIGCCCCHWATTTEHPYNYKHYDWVQIETALLFVG